MKKVAVWILLIVVAGLWSYSKFKSAQQQVVSEKLTLHLYAMSDYFPQDVLTTFEKQFNCTVRYDNFASNEELLAKLQAGATGYDVIVPSDYMVRALVASGLVLDLDKSKIPNIKNLAVDFVQVPYDPDSKNSVAYTWGTTGLIYNTKFVKEEIKSWDQVFKKEYAHHVSLLDDVREVFGAFLQKSGFSNNSTEKAELLQAQQYLLKVKSNVRLFSSDPKQHLYSGDVWIAHVYSGDAQQVIRSRPEFKYVVPQEGGVLWIDTLAIPKGSAHQDLAYAFINYILEPTTAKLITEQLFYSSPNQAIENLIDRENLRPSSLKKIKVGRLEFLKDLGASSEMWDQLWTAAKSK